MGEGETIRVTLDKIIKIQLKRINAFQGLVIDTDTWQDAHDYHRNQHRLHLLAFHSTGIVQGLKVVDNDPPDLSVNIEPGLAIDPEGNSIIVPEAQPYQIQTRQKGTIYLIIQFREYLLNRTNPQKMVRQHASWKRTGYRRGTNYQMNHMLNWLALTLILPKQ